ncbi:hypothetical protein AVEN_222235-1, partial [Araneus ventricosus]
QKKWRSCWDCGLYSSYSYWCVLLHAHSPEKEVSPFELKNPLVWTCVTSICH